MIFNRRHFMQFTGTAVAASAAGLPIVGMTQGPPRILADDAVFELISRAGKAFAEGVVAAKDGMIYLTDITTTIEVKENNPGGTIYRYDPATGQTTKLMEPSGMAIGLHVDKSGDLIICQGADTGGRAVLRRDLTTGATTVVADGYQGKRLNSPNDVTSDARGRIYFTDARYLGAEPMELPNAVYRVDPDGKIIQLMTDIVRPNGIEVSPDGKRLYVSASNSTGRRRVNPNGPVQDRFGFTDGGIAVYDLDGDGNISNGRAFFRADEISGDGMAMDTDGNVYMTGHNANPREPKGTVVVLDPDGRLLQNIPLPVPMLSTQLGFGRGADATSLYLTAASPWRLYRIKTVRRGHYFE